MYQIVHLGFGELGEGNKRLGFAQDSNNSVRRIRSEWVQVRKYQALRILHADTSAYLSERERPRDVNPSY